MTDEQELAQLNSNTGAPPLLTDEQELSLLNGETLKPVNMADYEDVTAEYAPLFESKPKPKPRPVSFDMQMYLDSVKEPQKEADKIKSAISNSIFLDIPASAAYSFNDVINAEQKKRGIELGKT